MYQWISNLVNSKRGMATVRVRSAEAAVVMERYQCGRTQGDKLVFSAIDKEKLANKAVSHDHVLINSPSGVLQSQ